MDYQLLREDQMNYVTSRIRQFHRSALNRDGNKDLTPQDKDKDLTLKDQDKDKDLTPKDKDKDLTPLQGPGQGPRLDK